MSGEADAQPLSVRIRCALQSFDDLALTCPPDCSVAELKRKLEDLCPSKPDAKRQRLIYAGHCLHDEHTLKSIFERRSMGDNSVHVIHLVSPPKDVAEFCEIRRRNVPQTQTSNSSTSTANAARLVSNPSVPSDIVQPYPSMSGAQLANVQSNSQFQSAYQAYMISYSNYMNQMMSAMGNNPQAVYFSSMLNNNQQQQPTMAVTMQQQQNINQVPQVFEAPQVNMAPAARAAGGIMQEAVAGDIDPPPRDFLDVIYKAIRMCFLIMLVYVYSSVERFLGVLIFILLVWFVQARRDRTNRQRADRELTAAVNNVRQQNQEQQQQQQLSDVSSENEAIDDDALNVQNAWMVFWSTCYTFITSFFSSLIPENPHPINVN